MRTTPYLKTVIAISTVALFAACTPTNSSGSNVSASGYASWSSVPLDNDYHRQHSEMVVRHQQEDSYPSANESSDQRHARHDNEDKDLDKRYEKGKKDHRDSMPDSDR
jgi:hypothetical protein